ncbi:MAG: polyphenol oxidase family protein [Deltaproteobacteria bacterium]|jgi:YfiH family protein|nr:polyphenol oxidase family protein [Deltaproteobacteria bacterium]
MQLIERTINGYQILSIQEWLTSGLEHGFMNAQLDVSLESGRDWDKVYPASKLKLLKQMHGTHTILVSGNFETDAISAPLTADGWWIDLKSAPQNVAWGIKTADCAPVIVYLKSFKIVYVLHCGWRGTVDNYLALVLKQALETYHCAAEDFEICVGPAAGKCCYEVGYEVVELAEKNFLALGGTLELLAQILIKKEGEKYYFNNSGLLKAQSLLLGVPEQNIYLIPACTICDPAYFSFRRQGDAAGRQVTFVKA